MHNIYLLQLAGPDVPTLQYIFLEQFYAEAKALENVCGECCCAGGLGGRRVCCCVSRDRLGGLEGKLWHLATAMGKPHHPKMATGRIMLLGEQRNCASCTILWLQPSLPSNLYSEVMALLHSPHPFGDLGIPQG